MYGSAYACKHRHMGGLVCGGGRGGSMVGFQGNRKHCTLNTRKISDVENQSPKYNNAGVGGEKSEGRGKQEKKKNDQKVSQ